MKVWERVVEARLRKVVEICEQQYGFMPRKSTTDAIFALRILMEKYRDGQRELHCVFVDLEKAYDRVPREELWYCMRKSGVAEKYVRVVQDMYERSRTVVRCAVGQTEEFNVEVGLHQGSALSPFLFAIVMDQLSEEVRQESPWTMMFADDIVICSESREQVEENLEMWRFALERRGMKVSHSKTEYMCVNEREGSGTVRLQGEEVKKVQEFKYLGSTVQSNGECGKEVKKRVQAGWNGWRKVSGVLCDQKISARIKGKVYRTVVRPAMLYGLETVSLRKRQESELEVAELKMLRFSLGVTRLDRIRNEYIRGTAHVGRLGDKVREARLRWFGHVQRREMIPWKGASPWSTDRPWHYQKVAEFSCSHPWCLVDGLLLDHRKLYKRWRNCWAAQLGETHPRMPGVEWAAMQPTWLDGASKDLYWLGALRRLPVRERLYRHGISPTPLCPIGCGGEETVEHALWSCPVAARFWRRVSEWWSAEEGAGIDRDLVLYGRGLKRMGPETANPLWQTVSVAKCVLWGARCKCIRSQTPRVRQVDLFHVFRARLGKVKQ
ncbi:hypothetical protein QTP86_002962, partial [Hemibagrus guttatus]